MKSAEEIWTKHGADYVTALNWSADGRFLAAALGNGSIEVRAADTGEVISTLAAHPLGVFGVAWRPGSTQLASCGHEREARLWEALEGRELHRLKGGNHAVEHIAWKPDGSRLATSSGRRLAVWDTAGQLQWEFAGHEGTVNAVQWSRHENQVATATNGGLRVLTVGESKPKFALLGRSSFIFLVWRPGEKMAAACTQSGQIILWTVTGEGDPVISVSSHGQIRRLVWSSSGRFLAADGTELIFLWHFRDNFPQHAPPFLVEGHIGMIRALAFHPSVELLATADNGGLALLTKPEPGAEAERLIYLRSAITAMQWSPDGAHIALGTDDGRIACCAVATAAMPMHNIAADEIPF